MRRKHARVCAGCRASVPARYRAVVDEFLCETCYQGWFSRRAERRARDVEAPPPPVMQPEPLVPPGADNTADELFDLSHLVPK